MVAATMDATSKVPSRLQGPGVLIRTIDKGDGITFPKPGDTCLVHFDAFLEDGTEIDSSRHRRSARPLPLEFQVGRGDVVRGWDMALPRMSVGQTAEVTIPPLLGYGSTGCPPKVPPDATLMYRITLLQVS